MDKKTFNLGEVLSLIYALNLSLRGFVGTLELADYMTGQKLDAIGLTDEISDTCKEGLLRQFPELGGREVQEEIEKIRRQLEDTPDAEKGVVLEDWLTEMEKSYGTMLTVESLPRWEVLPEDRTEVAGREIKEATGKDPIVTKETEFGSSHEDQGFPGSEGRRN